MLTRTNPKNGDELSILGFGCMRLPTKNMGIDEPRAIALIRDAIEQGVNYFDTAYFYHVGKSEPLLGKALAGGYRERVKIATKLPPFQINKLEQAQKIFASQLEKLQTGYIDYYLLHMLTDKAGYERLRGLGIITWLEDLKQKRVIHNIGFSFHGSKAEFEEIVKAYPWDFCQIQYNYMDEHNQATKSGLQLAASLGMAVIIMEPLRGGRLVTHLPAEVKEAFAQYDPKRSPAEWALRWIWNHPEASVVLSGMSDEAQLAENIAIASEAKADSLSRAELDVFEKVKAVLHEKTKIPCTSCGYCMPCPAGVDIPGCFSCYNDKYLTADKSIRRRYYQALGLTAVKPAFASQCKACGLCESHCPQQIPISEKLSMVSNEMENGIYKLLVRIARKYLKLS